MSRNKIVNKFSLVCNAVAFSSFIVSIGKTNVLYGFINLYIKTLLSLRKKSPQFKERVCHIKFLFRIYYITVLRESQPFFRFFLILRYFYSSVSLFSRVRFIWNRHISITPNIPPTIKLSTPVNHIITCLLNKIEKF